MRNYRIYVEIFKYGGGGHFSISMRASGRLKGYCEFVHFDDDSNLIDYFGPEVRKVEEGLMMISEWADSKWETVITENRKEMGDVSQNV